MIDVNYDGLTAVNNEIINMQRELYKKNTEIVRLLETQERLNKELQQAVNAKDRVLSIIGHDLRTPLGTIIGSLEYVIQNRGSYEDLVDSNFLEGLKDSVGNTILLLENLLEWSRSQIGELKPKPEAFILQDAISEAISINDGHSSGKKIEISKEFGENIAVFADRRMTGTVMRNLLSNAIKFSYEEEKVEVRVLCINEFAQATIIDHGTGMTREKINSLFGNDAGDSVYGTKGEKGAGFGLVLCKRFIEQNGGAISVSSEPGRGSAFSVTLPLAR